MDFIYSIDLSSYISDDELKPTDSCSCALSSRNILAIANDCCVYVLPLEKPNELIPVNLSNSPCVYLSWSEDGLYLLSICKNGICRLHNLKVKIEFYFFNWLNLLNFSSSQDKPAEPNRLGFFVSNQQKRTHLRKTLQQTTKSNCLSIYK